MKEEHKHEPKAKKYGMVIDLDQCTGCGACMVACMAENNVPFRKDETDKFLSITWMRVYQLTNGKSFPNTEICYLHALRRGAWPFAVCLGLPGNGHGLQP